MNPIDALAISMLAVVGLSFGLIALLFISMARKAARHDPQIEELIQDALTETQSPTPAPAPAPAKSWERDPDWWQKNQ